MDSEAPPGDGTGSSPASVLAVLEGMRLAGVDVDAVCAAAKLAPGELEDRETLVPTAQLSVLWREALRLYGRGTLGIATAMNAPIGRVIVDYVASTSATLRQALEQLVRYHRLITQNGDYRIEPAGSRTMISLRPVVGAIVPSPILEFSIGCVVRRIAAWTGARALGVQFAHPPLGPRADYDVLDTPVRFEAEHAGILVDDDLLARPCRGHDPNLFRVVRAHAELLLERIPRDASMRGQVRRVLLGLIAQGEPEMGAVAKALALSERSLQRRLQEEGTSFRDVVDDARKDLALGYLGDRTLAVSEVAYLLGYSEAGAFVRAFKRWTGTTPSQMRGA